MKILFGDEKMDESEWRYLLTGPSGDIHIPDNPTTWVDNNQWQDMYRQIHGVNLLPVFNGFLEGFMSNPNQWLPMYESQ